MAKTKTTPKKKAAKKSAVKKPAAKPLRRATRTKSSASGPRGEPRTADGQLVQLLTMLPALDDLHRDAFFEQFTNQACMELGRRTKSSAVREQAFAWAVAAAPALLGADTKHRIGYAAMRLTWLVELVAELDRVKAGAPRSADAASLRNARDILREKAKAERARLKARLAVALAGDAGAALLAGAPTNDEELIEALHSLATLADKLLTGTHAERIRAASANLTDVDASAAIGIADALHDARHDVTLGGRAARDRDTPEVNAVEGRILHELLLLRDAFDHARTDGVPVPAFVPNSGTAGVLARTSAA